MNTINIGTIDNPHYLTFEVIYNQTLNNFDYIVNWDNDNDFIMSLDPNAGQPIIKGVAPYAAREVEDKIANTIQAYFAAAA